MTLGLSIGNDTGYIKLPAEDPGHDQFVGTIDTDANTGAADPPNYAPTAGGGEGHATQMEQVAQIPDMVASRLRPARFNVSNNQFVPKEKRLMCSYPLCAITGDDRCCCGCTWYFPCMIFFECKDPHAHAKSRRSQEEGDPEDV